MAQKVMRLLLCDLHEDEVEGQETVLFSLDSASYEIDLCSKHAQELRDSLTPFVRHARRPTAMIRGRGRRPRGVSSRERSAEIRAWAKAHGRKVSERGRIPQSIVDEYEAAARG